MMSEDNLKDRKQILGEKLGMEGVTMGIKKINDEELGQVSGGCEEESLTGHYYIIFQNPYEKIGPFDTMGQADAYLSGISGRPCEIVVEF